MKINYWLDFAVLLLIRDQYGLSLPVNPSGLVEVNSPECKAIGLESHPGCMWFFSAWLLRAQTYRLMSRSHKPFSHCISYPRGIQPWGGPRSLFTPGLPRCTFTLSRQGSYTTGFRLHVSRIPRGFTAYPYSRAGVAIPRGMPICWGRSGVKRSKCERAGCYSPGFSRRVEQCENGYRMQVMG